MKTFGEYVKESRKVKITESGDAESRFQKLANTLYNWDEERYEPVAYYTSRGHKSEGIILFDKRFSDFEYIDFENGRSRAQGPIGKSKSEMKSKIEYNLKREVEFGQPKREITYFGKYK